jgi:hypothetical protein
MTKGARDLGRFLGNTNSVPESLQITLAGGAMVLFLVLLWLDVASVFVLIPGTVIGSLALYFIAFRIPALRISLVVYEHGLESVVHGQSRSFAYDELSAISARFTDHLVNRQYIGTRARIELFVDGRASSHVHECEFRRGYHGERVVVLAIERCSREVERKLLAQLERDGTLHWRDDVALTPDGLLLVEESASRLIPYDQIGGWKVDEGELQIFKNGNGLPFFVMKNDTINFTPLFGLFQSLCQAIRNIEATSPSAPAVPVG